MDYLGLKVTEALPENAPPELHEAFRDCCSWLNRERKEIWVYPHRSRRSKRANKLHEATHFICPTHVEVNVFSCKETDTERPGYRRQEQEAFQGSSAFLMPLDTFIDNILSYPTSLKAIEELHDLYDAPLAVAAIWYAYANPGLCAVVMVEPNIAVPEGAGTPLEHSNGQLHFPLEIPLQPAQRSRISYAARSGKHVQLDGPRAIFPLRVRYSSHSARFPKFIKAGLGIDEGSPIFKAWREQRRITDEIPASAFGSSEKWDYHAECLPIGRDGKVLTLLWLTDHQRDFKFFVGGNP